VGSSASVARAEGRLARYPAIGSPVTGTVPASENPAGGSVVDGDHHVRRLDDRLDLTALRDPELADRLHGDRRDDSLANLRPAWRPLALARVLVVTPASSSSSHRSNSSSIARPGITRAQGCVADLERSSSIEEAGELEDSSWLVVKPGEHERLALRPKLSREHVQSPNPNRVDEAKVLEAEDNLAFCAAN